jgi:hypothetical protein
MSRAFGETTAMQINNLHDSSLTATVGAAEKRTTILYQLTPFVDEIQALLTG